jgi:hypothetical protein
LQPPVHGKFLSRYWPLPNFVVYATKDCSPDAGFGARSGHEPGRVALLRRPDIWADRQLGPTRFMAAWELQIENCKMQIAN